MKVDINKEIAEKLEKRVKEKDDFKSVEEYINYILGQVVERLDEDSEKKDEEGEEVYSEEDEEKVKERLRSLGYLD